MAIPKLNNLLSTIEGIATDVRDTAPIVRSAIDSVTIAAGKHPAPTGTQLPPTTQTLSKEQGAAAISGFLWLGVAAVVVILFGAVRFRR